MGVHPHAFKLSCQGTAIECGTGANTRNHRIQTVDDMPTAIMHLGQLIIELHIAIFNIVKHHVMAALLAGFHDALVAVEIRITG